MGDVMQKINELEAQLAELKTQLAGKAICTVKVGDLEWQADVPDEEFTWEDAKAYAASLGDGWRLPTVKELLSLVDYDRRCPACSVFPDCPSEWYWSSSAYVGNTAFAWGVNFSNGDTTSSDVSNTDRVRCVR